MAEVDDEEPGTKTSSDDIASPELPTASGTLLPAPIASLVSFATKSSSVSLQLGTFIGGLAINGAKATTLTGLELSRSVVETIFLRAGREVADRSTGGLGKDEAEGLLERSILALHRTLTHASFVVAAGFHLSSASLASSSTLSLHVLSSLNAVLGSTESSRAIASIVTLIRREFDNPETGAKGERIGVADLLVGVCGLALVQSWCWKQTEKDRISKGAEAIIWDVVVLDDGTRADVADGRTDQEVIIPDALHEQRAEFVSDVPGAQNALLRSTSERVGGLQELGRSDPTSDDAEINLRRQILEQMPSAANVSITSETVTTKTITVEVSGPDQLCLSPPPGMLVAEEKTWCGHPQASSDDSRPPGTTLHRVVYQTTKERLRSTSLERENPSDLGREPLSVQNQVTEVLPDDPSSSASSTTLDVSPLPSPYSEKGYDFQSPFETLTSGGESERPSKVQRKDSVTGSSAQTKRSSKSWSVQQNAANQKRLRKPNATSPPGSGSEKPGPLNLKLPLPKAAAKSKQTEPAKTEKKGGLRRALRKRTSNTSVANFWSKDGSTPVLSTVEKQRDSKPAWGSGLKPVSSKPARPPRLPVPQTHSRPSLNKDLPREPQRGNPNYFSSRDLGLARPPRSPSRASLYSVHERRRDSFVSTTDTYSLIAAESARPGSPVQYRSQLGASSSHARADSSTNAAVNRLAPPSPTPTRHRPSNSYAPSIYTLHTNNSETSLMLASRPPPSALDDQESVMRLHNGGVIEGIFPTAHFVRNITRFIRFASAAYGSSFLKFMGIASSTESKAIERDISHHYEHYSFSNHTRLPPSTILLSSFVDPQGGTNAAGETDTGVPLVHYVSLDHDSKAVVLACRGTLGFEDVLTDISCEYTDLHWRGKSYKVHKGIQASARRLIEGGGGRVMATIKAALEEFPEYGFVLCGHSLGGAVAAILAILLAIPDASNGGGSTFVTAATPPQSPLLLRSASFDNTSLPPVPIKLPPNRRIHVYAYGPPATISPSLRVATRGLVTTIVNRQDLVPYLSLGVLHDLQAVALAFKTDTSNAKGEVRRRVWEGLKSGLAERVFGDEAVPAVSPAHGSVGDEDQWALSALKSLRVNMLSSKLCPPGEVFVVETQRVLQRHAFTPGNDAAKLGRPATRAVLRYVRDVEGRFGEVRFGASMLGDHSPGRYEASLAALGKGVLEG
ncbi:MAG: hypothetical protein M1833_006211 [Piccolia ochrophora]|nr:MAG: hypothetical protein M1833_006211 [Piccolia ochrophora]